MVGLNLDYYGLTSCTDKLVISELNHLGNLTGCVVDDHWFAFT